MTYPANHTTDSTPHLTRESGARITLRELDHYIVVTHAVNAPKGTSTEYFIERTLYNGHIKEQVDYALRTGEFKDGALIKLLTHANLVCEGDLLVKCRYDLGDLLEAHHVKTQAELKEAAHIFAVPPVEYPDEQSASTTLQRSDV